MYTCIYKYLRHQNAQLQDFNHGQKIPNIMIYSSKMT